MKDPEFRRHYDALGPEFIVIQMMIQKRREGRLSQAQLAKKIGTKQSAISRFEAGNGNPTVLFLYKMADALGMKLKITITHPRM